MNPLLDHTDSSKVHWPRKHKFARKAKSTNEDQVEKFQARALLQHVRKAVFWSTENLKDNLRKYRYTRIKGSIKTVQEDFICAWSVS